MKKAPKFFDYNVYVACSLTHAPQEFREKIEIFKQKLRSVCNVLCFLGIDGHPPHKIYDFDINKCVRKSDLVVAICDLPSIGLGVEMGTQIEARRMPCLALAHEKSHVTCFVLDTRQPHYEFRRYRDLEKDAVEMVIETLGKMKKDKRQKCFNIEATELSRQWSSKNLKKKIVT
jgi:hypothetical protein